MERASNTNINLKAEATNSSPKKRRPKSCFLNTISTYSINQTKYQHQILRIFFLFFIFLSNQNLRNLSLHVPLKLPSNWQNNQYNLNSISTKHLGIIYLLGSREVCNQLYSSMNKLSHIIYAIIWD